MSLGTCWLKEVKSLLTPLQHKRTLVKAAEQALSVAKKTEQTLVIGAGPAGLTAADHLVRHGRNTVVLEADAAKVGGISQTAEYKGYRFDIGGHRFFSKNDQVEQLWTDWLGEDMLRVGRLSRILYNGRFFDYPLKARNAFENLGLVETVRCVLSYLVSQLFPRRPENSFQDWVINRFGERLFSIFFKTYTEKVWGMSCDQISADWAAQRIKNLNLFRAGLNALGFGRNGKSIKTLIDEFRYPRLGPGMMWERVAEKLEQAGSQVLMDHRAEKIRWNENGVFQVVAKETTFSVDHVVSSMPLRHLVESLDPAPPVEVLEAAQNLRYRDYLTVVLVLDVADLFPDNWIYIHDPDVQVGRIQNYKNWSAEMVPNPAYTCLGLEYFCDMGDPIWELSESELVELGLQELVQLGLASSEQMRDGTVVRMPRAYPVYDEHYQSRVDLVRAFLAEKLPNLQVIGRNGMHRYNNQDHAMMTGILAAQNILGHGPRDPWLVNADAEYLETDESEVTEGRLFPRRIE